MIHIQQMLSEIQPKVGNVTFIAVDGHSGSGKTTLADILSEKLEAEITHTDNFSGWNNPLNWYPHLIENVFIPIQNNSTTVTFQPAQAWRGEPLKPRITQYITKLMILEGVSATRKEFDEYVSLKIFVDAPKGICLERGIERDRVRGQNEEELLALWHHWFTEEDTYMLRDNPKENADIVIDGTKPFEEQINFEV